MIIKVLDGDFSVCQLGGPEGISFADDFLFLGKTDQELSLVCRSETAPDNALAREDGWKAFRIEGALDFSLVGVLAELAGFAGASRHQHFCRVHLCHGLHPGEAGEILRSSGRPGTSWPRVGLNVLLFPAFGRTLIHL